MNDFHSLFAKNLSGINKAFEDADHDLHSTIQVAGAGLLRATKGQFTLMIDPVSEFPKGLVYEFKVGHEKEWQTLGAFRVVPSGYPIESGLWDPAPIFEEFERKLGHESKDVLEKFLERMIENSDSQLMMYLAFKLRGAPE